MWVIFEGLDKSGKGTLEWEFLKATNFKHIVIDRGPAGYVVFDTLFKRVSKDSVDECANAIADMKITKNFIVVYCKAPFDVVMKRLMEHNEICPYDYKRAQKLYDEAIESLYREEGIKVITINTSRPIKQCIDFIIDSM